MEGGTVSIEFVKYLLGAMGVAVAGVSVAYVRHLHDTIKRLRVTVARRESEINRLTAGINRFSNAMGYSKEIDDVDAAETFIGEHTMSMTGEV